MDKKKTRSARFSTSDSWTILLADELTDPSGGALSIETLPGGKGKVLRIKTDIPDFFIVPHVESDDLEDNKKQYFTFFNLVKTAEVRSPQKP